MDETIFKIPESDNSLRIVQAIDSHSDLIAKYNQIYRLINGQTISDISLIWSELTDWMTVERADLIIPYQFAKQRQEPPGHRIWYLSQQDRTSRYYNGCLFDLRVTETDKRLIRKQCRLSGEAKLFFRAHREIIRNELIDRSLNANHY